MSTEMHKPSYRKGLMRGALATAITVGPVSYWAGHKYWPTYVSNSGVTSGAPAVPQKTLSERLSDFWENEVPTQEQVWDAVPEREEVYNFGQGLYESATDDQFDMFDMGIAFLAGAVVMGLILKRRSIGSGAVNMVRRVGHAIRTGDVPTASHK